MATDRRGRETLIRQEETPWLARATVLLDDGRRRNDASVAAHTQPPCSATSTLERSRSAPANRSRPLGGRCRRRGREEGTLRGL